MKKIFILGLFLTAMPVHAEIPTVQYMLEFYNRSCGWPDDFGFIEYMQGVFQDAGISLSSIPSQWWPLAMIDYEFNEGNTSYNTQLTTDNVISVGFLQDTLNLIDMPIPICCKNGSQLDPDSFSCIGTITCPNGQVFDTLYGQCSVPYDDTYTGTMASGPMCTPRAYVRENVTCPTGWERVELANAYVYSGFFVGHETKYSDEWRADDCVTALGIASGTEAPVDVCIPPVHGEIVVATELVDYGYFYEMPNGYYWAIGDNCVASGADVTCDVTRVAGLGGCGGNECSCAVVGAMSSTGTFLGRDEWSGRMSWAVPLKRYGTSDECTANCARDCANAIQKFPGFRRMCMAVEPGICTG